MSTRVSRVNSARNQYIPIDIIHGYYYSGNLTQTEITISDYKYFSNRNYSEGNTFTIYTQW